MDIESTTLNTCTDILNIDTGVDDNAEVIDSFDPNDSAIFFSNKSDNDITFALLFNMTGHLRQNREGDFIISIHKKF